MASLCRTAAAFEAEYPMRLLDIALDLRAQGIERVELVLIADALDKIHFDLATVDVAIEVKQVDLEQEAVVAFKRGAVADIGNTGQRLVSQSHDLDREYAAQRGRTPQQRYIHGRETDRPATLVPMGDPAADPVTPAQTMCRTLEIAGLQGITNPRTADAIPVTSHRGKALDTEALLHAHVAQQGEVSTTISPEAEIVADVQVLNAKLVNQGVADKLVRLDPGKRPIEANQQHPVDAATGDRLDLFTQTGQSGRCLVRAKELHRLGLEGDDRRWQPGIARTGNQRREDGLMTEVDTIEIADCGHAAAVCSAQVMQSPNQ